MPRAYLDYTTGKQSLKQLRSKYGKSVSTIRKYFEKHSPVTGEVNTPNHPIVVVLDAFFWSRSSGVLVARANKKNLIWRDIKSEKMEHYEALLNDLKVLDIQPVAFVIDGRRGVRQLLLKMFPRIPVQLCQFHAVQTVTKYLTKKPKLEAGKQLRKITLDLKHCGESRFARKLKKWHRRWCNFLNERTLDDSSRGWHYTHKRLRSAYFSLQRNLPWLFTCRKHPKLNILNTTNSCDGYFAHLKQKVKLHRGLRPHRRKKMADYFLENGVT